MSFFVYNKDFSTSDRHLKLKNLEVDKLVEEIENEKTKEKNIHQFVPRIKNVLDTYHITEDAEKKNSLLKSVIEKVTYLREMEWKKKDQFTIQLYSKV